MLAGALCLVIVGASGQAARSDDQGESLGSQLLDDLDPNEFSPPSKAEPGSADRPKRILPGVTDDDLGEDLGQPSAGAPLVRVKQNMESAQSLIPGRKSLDRAVPLQDRVVADLDAMIEQLEKQCSASPQPNEQPAISSRRSQTAGAKRSSKPGRGTAAARDSEARIQQGDSQAAHLADRRALVRDMWGHLPPQVREQMLQLHSDEFLPQYELEIEKYFRRLAEDDKSAN
jgi:hypothetical protein